MPDRHARMWRCGCRFSWLRPTPSRSAHDRPDHATSPHRQAAYHLPRRTAPDPPTALIERLDPGLVVALTGWGPTTRYAMLRLVERWPAAILAVGTSGIVGAVARARGWL